MNLLACAVGGGCGVVLALTIWLYVVRRRRSLKYPERLASPEPSQSTQRKPDLVKHGSLGSETSSHTSRSPLTQFRRNVRVGSTAPYHLQNGYLERDSPLAGQSPQRWQTNRAGTGYPLKHSNSAWHDHASSFRRHVVSVLIHHHPALRQTSEHSLARACCRIQDHVRSLIQTARSAAFPTLDVMMLLF